jgi:hypothetical protein
VLFQEKRNENLPQNICNSCIADLDASYRFKMNCESSDAILQNYFGTSVNSPDGNVSEDEGEIITEIESEAEPEMPVDESDLYNYQSQMYDENGEMICEEDNLENVLDVSWWSFHDVSVVDVVNFLGWPKAQRDNRRETTETWEKERKFKVESSEGKEKPNRQKHCPRASEGSHMRNLRELVQIPARVRGPHEEVRRNFP